jgi:hypothetical protein
MTPVYEPKSHPPRSLLDKLGVKPGCRVSTAGQADDDLVRQVRVRTEDVHVGQLAPVSDLIFYRIEEPACLEHLAGLVPHLKPNGAIWIISPRGVPGLKDTEIMAAGKAAGLVDVKVVRYSGTHTGNKFVIPVALRPKVQTRATEA